MNEEIKAFKRPLPPLISSVQQAVDNIHALNLWLEQEPFSLNAAFPGVRRWYAIFDRPSQRWMFGFSKFIGYANMTGHRYQSYLTSQKGSREWLNGRRTELKSETLWTHSVPAYPDTPLHDELFPLLCEFLAGQKRGKPRSDYSIRVLAGHARKSA